MRAPGSLRRQSWQLGRAVLAYVVLLAVGDGWLGAGLGHRGRVVRGQACGGPVLLVPIASGSRALSDLLRIFLHVVSVKLFICGRGGGVGVARDARREEEERRETQRRREKKRERIPPGKSKCGQHTQGNTWAYSR